MFLHIETAKYAETRHQIVQRPAELSTLRLFVDSSQTDQIMLGFGGAFTEAAALTFYQMSPQSQARILKAYFDPQEGLGYSLGRVSIHSCDFALGHYTYVDEDDETLDSFSIERDQQSIIPMILAAEQVRGSAILLLASPWSPPAWMKSNRQMSQGGRLLPKYYNTWARYFVKFIDHYTQHGLTLFAVTVQNEPAAVQVWDSCVYTALEEQTFVKDHLGPAVRDSDHPHVKILIWDHNRDLLVERASTILADPETAQYVWGTAFHWYVSEDFEQVGILHRAFPDKHLLFTEGCIEGGPKPGVFETGERYARNMIGDLAQGCEGYIDWNLILNAQGGPNHVGNYCDAPILCDPATDTVQFNASFDAIKHFSAHIKPGAVRIISHLNTPTLGHVAFQNPDGSHVLIVQNETESDVAVRLETTHTQADVHILKRSISTFIMRGDHHDAL